MKPSLAAFKTISLHPAFASALCGVISIPLLWFLKSASEWWWLILWFGLQSVVWGGLVKLVSAPAGVDKLKLWLNLVFFGLGLGLYSVFMDQTFLWYLPVGVLVVGPAINFLFIPSRQTVLSFSLKPLRRLELMMTVCGVAGLASGLFASFTFQLVGWSWWWLILVVALIMTGAAAWWWNMYLGERHTSAIRQLVTFFVLLVEILAVLLLWPLGFLAGGLLVAWLWYILFLLFRFSLSPEGIFWAKQKMFLIVNGVLLFLYVFLVVRWR